MKIEEITEGATMIFGSRGNKVVSKYRCTSGSRKGRIVAKPATCTAPKRVKASQTMKATRRAKGRTQAIKTTRTKKFSSASRRLSKVNRRTGAKRRRKI